MKENMKKISTKQAAKNRTLMKIKRMMNDRCYFCGMKGCDLMHILPRSIFGEYMCEEWNLIIGCRSCHELFDGNREFRRNQPDLFERVLEMVDKKDDGMVRKYFGMI